MSASRIIIISFSILCCAFQNFYTKDVIWKKWEKNLNTKINKYFFLRYFATDSFIS